MFSMTKTILKRPYLVAIIAGTLIAVTALTTSSTVFAQGPPQGNPAQATEMVVMSCTINGSDAAFPILVAGQSSSSGITAPPARGDDCAQTLADLQNSGLSIIAIEPSTGAFQYTLSSNP